MIIRITARRAGFRRCGIAHPAEPIDYPFDRFDEGELKKLQAENMLIVEVLDDESAGTDSTSSEADSKSNGVESAAPKSGRGKKPADSKSSEAEPEGTA